MLQGFEPSGLKCAYLLNRIEIEFGLTADFRLASGREGPCRDAAGHRSALLCKIHEVEAAYKLLLSQERRTARDYLPHILQGLPGET